jgi:hypothetical protein
MSDIRSCDAATCCQGVPAVFIETAQPYQEPAWLEQGHEGS